MSRYSVYRVKYARVIPSFVLTMVALGLLSYGFAAALPQTKTVATGAKAKAKGRIVQRDEDTLIIADSAGAKTVVLLTDSTSVLPAMSLLSSAAVPPVKLRLVST